MRFYCNAFVVILVLCAVALPAWPASAFAYDHESQIVGHGVAPTEEKAKNKARKNCEKNGGVPGRIGILHFSSDPGWGAIAGGDEGDLCATLGELTKRKAKQTAKGCCAAFDTNCKVADTLYDPGTKRAKHGKRHRARVNASR